MMLRKPLTAALIFVCLMANSAFATATGTTVEGRLGKAIDEYLRRLTGFGYSGTLLVVKDGKVVLNKAYGMANQEQRIANTTETIFDIGSLAKPFTAAAIL